MVHRADPAQDGRALAPPPHTFGSASHITWHRGFTGCWHQEHLVLVATQVRHSFHPYAINSTSMSDILLLGGQSGSEQCVCTNSPKALHTRRRLSTTSGPSRRPTNHEGWSASSAWHRIRWITSSGTLREGPIATPKFGGACGSACGGAAVAVHSSLCVSPQPRTQYHTWHILQSIK